MPRPPGQGRVTAAQVAAHAGVSQSAVSRAYTKGASVSPKTMEKGRSAATELGYRPNVLARAMASGRSRVIGLVVAYLENQFYPDALEKLSNALQEEGFHVLVFMASQAAGNIDTVVEEMIDHQVEGIIAASVALSSDLSERCQAVGVPMVLFNRSLDGSNLSAVTSDNRRGGREIAEFLVAGGHTSIGYIAGWEGASTQRDREEGFLAGLAAAGRCLDAWEVGAFLMDEARNAALRMCKNGPPDAIFVANDHMALSVMDCLRFDLGLDVPGNVSVVGYDDIPAAAWRAYDLTTMRQPTNRMVAATVDTLLSQIRGEAGPPESLEIPGPLILRGSARIPEGWPR